MGLFATGRSCFARVWVIGRSLDPVPPQRMIAFMPLLASRFWSPTDTGRRLVQDAETLQDFGDEGAANKARITALIRWKIRGGAPFVKEYILEDLSIGTIE